ncbi:MAG: hypothetical protein ABFS05_09300 [Bacteroidota bacterium]
MSNVVVKEAHLTFGGVAYFRAHAEEVEIGSIGEKRKPLTKQNYLEVKDRVQVPEKEIIQATVTEIDFNKTSKSAFNLNASAIIKGVPVKLDSDAVFRKLKAGELKLVKFSISNNDMKRAMNNSPQKLQDLIAWGNNARVVLQVFVVIEAKLADEFTRDMGIGISAGIKGLEAEVGGCFAASGSSRITLSQGTCFAYLLAKPDWDARKKKDRTRVVDLDDDQWGLN